jgi:carbonyl reductase 1
MLKTSLVTGANKGIGYEIAKGILKTKKFRVILACRSEELANKAAAQLISETDSPAENVLILPNFDLSKPETIKAAAAKLVASNSSSPFIDVLINNAGFAFSNDATEPTHVQAETTVGINYFGTKEVCRFFIPLVKDGGRVINVSSRAGLADKMKSQELQKIFTSPELTIAQLDELMNKYIELTKPEGSTKHLEAGWPNSTYMTSKVAESSLTRILAHAPENLKRGLKISCMTPGFCKSAMTRWAEDAKRTTAQGAETVLWLALDETRAETANGFFFDEEQQPISYLDGSKL